MKVLFYNHTGQISGGERVLLAILKTLDVRRFDSLLVCPSQGQLARSATELGVRTLCIEPLAARFTLRPDHLLRYFGSFAHTLRAARNLVRQEQPEIIHANSIRAGLVMSAATVGMDVKVVWHAHDLLPRHPLSSAIRVFAALSSRNRIVAVSQAVADRFRGTMLRVVKQRTPIFTIHNAVDVENFHPDPEARQVTRRALGFTDDDFIIGIVGQLTPRKGQLELIEAFAPVARESPHAVLVVVGEALFNRDHEYAAELRETAARLGLSGRVHFLGQKEDVPALMRSFDLLVVNSRAEPFGLTVVEAMASRTPLLATAVDGICEIAQHTKTGWLVRQGDQSDLIEGLRQLVMDEKLHHDLSKAALTEVRSRFSMEVFSEKIQNLYGQIEERKTSQQKSAHKFEVKLSAD